MEPVSWPGSIHGCDCESHSVLARVCVLRWVCTSDRSTLIDGFRSPSTQRLLVPFMKATSRCVQCLSKRFTAIGTPRVCHNHIKYLIRRSFCLDFLSNDFQCQICLSPVKTMMCGRVFIQYHSTNQVKVYFLFLNR